MNKNHEDPFVVGRDSIIDGEKRVRLVDEESNFHDSIDVRDAQFRAQENGLDLVCFQGSSQNRLPLCKIIDYGKWKYKEDKKKKKNKQENSQSVKEICFSPSIAEHDVDHKVDHIKKIIDNGDLVTVTMKLDSRSASNSVAEKKLEQIIGKCSPFSKEVNRKNEGRFIRVRLGQKD